VTEQTERIYKNEKMNALRVTKNSFTRNMLLLRT